MFISLPSKNALLIRVKCDYTALEEYPMICPKCFSKDIRVNTYQDTAGSITIPTSSRSTASGKQTHGCLWWLTVGWWWEITKLATKVTFFFPRMIFRLISSPFKKKTQADNTTSHRSPVYSPKYVTVYTCNKCRHRWKMMN